MADATLDSIQRLIENSEKGLARIEKSSQVILKVRQAVLEAIDKQRDRNVISELTLVIMDSLLAENEVIYDVSASLNALLRAKDDYTKRYYMQVLNLCFCEACQLFVGEKNDENGLLYRLENLTKELNQAGCQFIAKHIIEDIKDFKEEYTDKELRNITRHYDDPIKMYEKQQGLSNIDYFARGASQLMAIRMEVSVVTYFLLNLVAPVDNEPPKANTPSKRDFALKEMFNGAIYKVFKEKNLKETVQQVLSEGQKTLDECYRLYGNCRKAKSFLEERNLPIPEELRKLESLILLRMEVLYLRYDIACSIWGYLNASSDKERSQNLRLIYITKQAALTHIYGYNIKVRENSLWARIKDMEEAGNEILNTDKVEESLRDLTTDLAVDRVNSNIFAHYRYKQDFYIPARLEAFDNLSHYKELDDSLKLIHVCKSLEDYSMQLLFCINEAKNEERKKQHNEWIVKFDSLAEKIGNDERAKGSLKAMRELVDQIYYLR